MEFYEKIK
jgi:putative transposase